jgi:hypothetical protein
MGRAVASTTVGIPPAEAIELWVDLARWPAFIDGFARTVAVSSEWPAAGAELVWESTRGGRGRVTERVESYEAPPPGPDVAIQSHPGRLLTRVRDDSLEGRQSASFAPVPDGTRIELELDYKLSGGGPVQGVTDLLFIRRAIRDSLGRTLDRFAAELSDGSPIH